MDIYDEMIAVSRRIASSFPDPQFYNCCGRELAISRRSHEDTPLITRCREAVEYDLKCNPGHGMDHAQKVSIEAGALVLTEGAKMALGEADVAEAMIISQIAGLLHDMRRADKDHARSGSIAADQLLRDFGVPDRERQWVVEAIANHEAFVKPVSIRSVIGKLVSDALYDADKFRWGPDNFTVTLWEMVRFDHAPLAALIPQFPAGMAGISRIKGTFRSHTGRVLGPEFIDLGLSIGKEIHEFLCRRCPKDFG